MARQDETAKEEESKEIQALCAEAEASIEELLPSGYLEYLQQLQESGKMDVDEVETRKRPADNNDDIVSRIFVCLLLLNFILVLKSIYCVW